MENQPPNPDAHRDNWNDFPSHLDVMSCILCDKKTQSHTLYLKYIPGTPQEDGHLLPITSRDDADLLQPVCHTCYQSVDGDAVAAANKYKERLRNASEPLGITFDAMVNEAFTTREREERINTSQNALESLTDLTPGDFIRVNDGGPYLVSQKLGERRYIVAGSPDGDELGKNITDEDLSRFLLHYANEDVMLEEIVDRPRWSEVVTRIEYESDIIRAFGPDV